MTRDCQNCGHAARDGDRFCVGCGQEVNAHAQPPDSTGSFQASDNRSRRSRSFVARHPRVLLIVAAIGAVSILAAVSGSSSDPSAPQADDIAPAATVTAEPNRATPVPSPETTATDPAQRSVTAKGANGKTYRCSFAVLARVDTAHARVKRRRRILHAQKAALAKLDKQYPGRTAPAAVADRYNALVKRANAQVTWTNAAIHRYNQVLVEACDRD
jgi:hypothetical protein